MTALSIQGQRVVLTPRNGNQGEGSVQVALRWTDDMTIEKVVIFLRKYLKRLEECPAKRQNIESLNVLCRALKKWLATDHTGQDPQEVCRVWMEQAESVQRVVGARENNQMPYIMIRNWTTPLDS